MFEWDAPVEIRLEIIETALGVIFDKIESDREVRQELVTRLRAKVVEAGYDESKRHGLQHAIARLTERYQVE